MYKLGLIKDINIGDKSSWSDKIFITLDVDWAPDFMINFVKKVMTRKTSQLYQKLLGAMLGIIQ